MSIRLRLILLVVGAALLPAIFMGWRYLQDREKDIALAKGSLTEIARSIASDLNAAVQSTAQLQFGLAQAQILAQRNRTACSNFLADVLDRNPQYTGLLTIDPDGQLYCDSLRTGRSLDLRDRDYFKRASASTDAFVIQPAFGRLTGSAVLQIATPARDAESKLRFVLLASLDLTKFIQEHAGRLVPGMKIVVADRDGQIFTQRTIGGHVAAKARDTVPPALIELVEGTSEHTTEMYNASAAPEVWAAANTASIDGSALHVFVGRAKADLVAGPDRRLAQDMTMLAVLSAFLFGGIWLLAEVSIRSQIGRIGQMARRMASGDLSARIPLPHPGGELGTLMTILNASAESIERQRSDIEDLNRQLRRAQELEAVERGRLDVAVSNMSQGLLLFDADNKVTLCNAQYLGMYRLSGEQAAPGTSLRELMLHRQQAGSFDGDVDAFCSDLLQNIRSGNVTSSAVETIGGRIVQSTRKPLANGGWLVTAEDVTQRKLDDERISYMAHYDALTDLPNRTLLHDHLDRALDGLQEGEMLSVLYLDVDQFKNVNDTLGHPVGDKLLKSVAIRLQERLGAADFAARIGGDEFAIIQRTNGRDSDIIDLVARVHDAMRTPFDLGDHVLAADASIGVAVAPRHGNSRDQLIRRADLALYEAKAAGRRTYRLFEESMEERVKARHTLELDLRKAIAEQQFEVYYQPVARIDSEVIAGFEALVRWRHPTRGFVSPAEFIPIAEETSLIEQIGEWVLFTSCAEASTWPSDIRVAVNVSPVQFCKPGFPLKVVSALAKSGLRPDRLELEVTEAVLIRDDEAALRTFHQLRDLGVRIALDDFGTGYSSLSYLQRFPFDKIKIDRSFIADLNAADGPASIVHTIMGLAAARNMTTTAEGVETPDQLASLRELGCSEMQGYLFSRPLPAGQIATLLARPSKEAPDAA